jgi:hypothetical protein
MNQASGQTATSSQDAQRQQQGQPTASQAAMSGQPASTDKASQVKAALNRARALDGSGNQECMGAINEAKSLIGTPWPKSVSELSCRSII